MAQWYGVIETRRSFPFGPITVEGGRSDSVIHVGSQDECTEFWQRKNAEQSALRHEVDEGRTAYTMDVARALNTRYRTARVYISLTPSE
jgi:hypothetical protein